MLLFLLLGLSCHCLFSLAEVRKHTVKVGDGDHNFTPAQFIASKGDIVAFIFTNGNHSVVRAQFRRPCAPYEYMAPERQGFNSGFRNITPGQTSTYEITVDTAEPVFFYCAQDNSCKGFAMVGVINPNATFDLTTQKQLARDTNLALKPGETLPPEQNPVPSSPPAVVDTPKHALSPGAIAGISVACAGILILAAALFFFIGRSKTLKQEVDRSTATIRHSESGAYPPPPFYDSPSMRHSAMSPQTMVSYDGSWDGRQQKALGSELQPVEIGGDSGQYRTSFGSPMSDGRIVSGVSECHPSLFLGASAPTELETQYSVCEQKH